MSAIIIIALIAGAALAFVLWHNRASARSIVVPAPAPKRKPIASTFFGHMIQGSWIQPDGALDHEVTVYVGLLRLWNATNWKYINPSPGVWNWEAFDGWLAYGAKNQIPLMYTFGDAPAHALAQGKSFMPTDAALTDFVGRVVARAAGRIAFFEEWNEPGFQESYDGTPEELARQSRLEFDLITLAQPDAVIVAPSMTALGVEMGQAFADRYFAAAGSSPPFHATALHAYTAEPELIFGDWNAMQSLTRKHGLDQLPVFNTEFAIRVADPALQAAYIAQSYVIQASLGFESATWDAEEVNDYTSDAMRRVADLLTGAVVGPLVISGNIRRVTLSRPNVPDVALIWTPTTFPTIAP
jgi:Glycosyl hydrolase catalytic core